MPITLKALGLVSFINTAGSDMLRWYPKESKMDFNLLYQSCAESGIPYKALSNLAFCPQGSVM